MKKISLLLLAVLLPVLLFSHDFSYSAEDLCDLINKNSAGKSEIYYNSQWHKGQTLLELLPLMEDVYRLTIQTEENIYTLTDDELGEEWSESYLVQSNRKLAFFFKGILYDDIKEFRFSGTPMESQSLEIWLSWEGINELRDELEVFARIHGVEIKAVEVPRPESKLISVIRAGGAVPDIIMLQSSAIENLVAARTLQNLNYLDLPDLMNQGIEAFSYENRLWALPFYSDTQVMFYNREIIKTSINSEWTLDDMERISRNIGDDSIHQLAWNSYSSNWLIPFEFSFGKRELIDSDGRISINDVPTQKALSYVINLQEKGLLSSMERDAMDALFIAGKVAFIMSGSYSIPYFASLGLNFGVLPLPINDETDLPLVPLLDFKGLAITRKTDSPILAKRVIQFLTSSAVQQRFCPAMAKLPARDGVLKIPGISYDYADVLDKSASRGIVIPPRNVYGIYKNNMWKLLRFALSGRMSVRQTLEQGQTLMENTTDN